MKSSSVNLASLFVAAGLPEPVLEYRFAPPRRWRWDVCWPEQMVAAEVMGKIWRQGRHTRGKGYINDCEKMAEGVLRGWRVFWFPTDWLKNGKAFAILERVFGRER